MSLYSEMMGSFIRTGNYPLEADLIFNSEESLQQWAVENRTILHEGLFKIVVEDSELKLFWAVKEGSGFTFKLYEGGRLTNEVVATNVNVGNIKNGDVLPEGMSFTQFVTKLLITPKAPTLVVTNFVNGSTNLDENGKTATVEVGTKVTGAKATYTQYQGGSITSTFATITGFLDPTTPTTTYSGSTISASFGDRIKEGSNTVKFTVNYAASTVFTEITAGSVTASKSINGARKYFTGNGSAPTNNSGIRSGSSRLATSSFTYNLNANSTDLWIAIPSNKRLTSVKDAGALNADITGNFVNINTLLIDGATSGKDATAYNVYQLSGYGPFGSPHTLTFNIG